MSAILTLQDVHRFASKTHIIKGVSLSLQQGQAVGLVGPNGCGKSSLINVINGFNKISQGKIIFNNQDITHLSVESRAQLGIGRVFQHPGIFKQLSLYENLALAFVHSLSWNQKLLPLSWLPVSYKNKINEILSELGLYDKKDQYAGNLSGGQMRLLEIARLYLQETQLFLLDEPTAGVSPKLKKTVVSLLNKIIQTGKTIIIVEHDFNFLASFVDSFYVMNDGMLVFQGNYQEVKTSKLVQELYFGH